MSNKEELKIGDKVKVIAGTGLFLIKLEEHRNSFKCISILVSFVNRTSDNVIHGYNVFLIDYKGIKKGSTYFYVYEIEKLDE